MLKAIDSTSKCHDNDHDDRLQNFTSCNYTMKYRVASVDDVNGSHVNGHGFVTDKSRKVMVLAMEIISHVRDELHVDVN